MHTCIHASCIHTYIRTYNHACMHACMHSTYIRTYVRSCILTVHARIHSSSGLIRDLVEAQFCNIRDLVRERIQAIIRRHGILQLPAFIEFRVCFRACVSELHRLPRLICRKVRHTARPSLGGRTCIVGLRAHNLSAGLLQALLELGEHRL